MAAVRAAMRSAASDDSTARHRSTGDSDRWTTTVTTYGDTHASYEKRAVLEVCRGLKEAICGLPLVRFENAALAHHLPVPGMPSSYELPDGVSTRSS